MQFYKKFIHSYFSWMGDICDAIQNANNIGILASCIEMQRFMIFYVEYRVELKFCYGTKDDIETKQ